MNLHLIPFLLFLDFLIVEDEAKLVELVDSVLLENTSKIVRPLNTYPPLQLVSVSAIGPRNVGVSWTSDGGGNC